MNSLKELNVVNWSNRWEREVKVEINDGKLQCRGMYGSDFIFGGSDGRGYD